MTTACGSAPKWVAAAHPARCRPLRKPMDNLNPFGLEIKLDEDAIRKEQDEHYVDCSDESAELGPRSEEEREEDKRRLLEVLCVEGPDDKRPFREILKNAARVHAQRWFDHRRRAKRNSRPVRRATARTPRRSRRASARVAPRASTSPRGDPPPGDPPSPRWSSSFADSAVRI